MEIQESLLKAIKKLRTAKINSAQLDAELILGHVLKKSKSFLLANPQKRITPTQKKIFFSLINKRKRGIPVAYLTNHKEFYGLDFYINKSVLIPRPETELLVEEAITSARSIKKQTKLSPPKNISIADIGTGSGCIAVSLARYLPFANIIATDISEKALKIAKLNARQHKVLSKITFKKSNLLDKLNKNSIDIIVANLPYLTNNELKNVRYEPKIALFGGKLGIELIEKLITQIADIRHQQKITILLEISPNQKKIVEYLAEQHFPGKMLFFIKDLAGLNRVIKIEQPPKLLTDKKLKG